jgi:hypothetical protein
MEVLVERRLHDSNRYEGFTDNYLRSAVTAGPSIRGNELVKMVVVGYDSKCLYGDCLEHATDGDPVS